MSKSALVLKFPSGEPIRPPPEEDPTRHTRWPGWLGALLAGAVIAGTAVGAFKRSDNTAPAPPRSPVLSGLQTVFSAEKFCRSHPQLMVRTRLHGVFYSGAALEAVSGLMFNSGPMPPEVTLSPQNYSSYPQYRPVLVTAWPEHETLLPASAWVTVSGVLSCTRPVGMEYLSYHPSNP
jgi:hypothetical protein